MTLCRDSTIQLKKIFLWWYRIRHLDPKLHKAEKPTPEEFIRYIIKTAKSLGPYALDNHIKPIWASCPFCSVEFDIVGHLEDFNKDSAFIHVNMDLMVRINTYLLLIGSYHTYWSCYMYCLIFFLIESIISTGRFQ